ncbi:MAG: hypothetical protein FWH24_01620 [Oscillospiraceae bacterium]|nr:hypothetical protein [Oscillospiraceae bacterium]
MRKNIICVILPVLLIIAGSCGQNAGPAAMSLEYNGAKTEFSTNIYSYYLSSTKTRTLMNLYTSFGIPPEQMQDRPEFWEDDELAAEIKEQAEYTMKQLLAVVAYCKEHDLTLSAEQRDRIDEYIRLVINEVFGRSKTGFNNTLARFLINEDIFREIRRYEALLGLVNTHIFDQETGRRPVPYEDILLIYETGFVRFKHIVIMTQSSELGVDGEPIEFTDEELADIRAGARDIYAELTEDGNGGEELFLRLMAEYSADNIPEDGYTISEASGLHEELTLALFEMETGEVRFVEMDGSIHIMKRYELLPPEQTPDLTSPGSSVAQTLTRSFQALILIDELAPYIENIIINTEETEKFSIKTSDTMFDVWDWME